MLSNNRDLQVFTPSLQSLAAVYTLTTVPQGATLPLDEQPMHSSATRVLRPKPSQGNVVSESLR